MPRQLCCGVRRRSLTIFLGSNRYRRKSPKKEVMSFTSLNHYLRHVLSCVSSFCKQKTLKKPHKYKPSAGKPCLHFSAMPMLCHGNSQISIHICQTIGIGFCLARIYWRGLNFQHYFLQFAVELERALIVIGGYRRLGVFAHLKAFFK